MPEVTRQQQEKSFQSDFLHRDFYEISNMKHIRLLHNPAAGNKDDSEQKLISRIEEVGFTCSYYSTKETEQEDFIDDKADIIAIAGGDGTVRKLVNQLIHRNMLDKRHPIGLVPCGTANNIGRMLGIHGTPDEIVERWKNQNYQPYDIAQVSGIREADFIMEGLGFGVFPKLIKKVKARKTQAGSPEEELKAALTFLHEIIENYKGREATVIIDGEKYTGQYLMVEIMNTQSVGPNLNLAPRASVSDGKLDVVLVPVSQREKLAAYVHDRLVHGKDELFFGTAIQGSEITVEWHGKFIHADDQLLEIKKPAMISVSARKGLIEFLV